MNETQATETGRLVKAWRREQGFSQKRAAKVLRTSERNIARWEGGTNVPRKSTVEKIAPRMGLDPEEFFPEENGFSGTAEARLAAVERALRGVQAELEVLNAQLDRAAMPRLAEALERLGGELPQAIERGSRAAAEAPRARRSRRAASRPSA